MSRKNKICLFIGVKASGKTYYTLNMFLKSYRERFPDKRILVITACHHPDYAHIPKITKERLKHWVGAGIYQIEVEFEIDDILVDINKYFSNGLIVFEDASAYFEGKVTPEQRRSIINHRQRNIDYVYQFHSFMDVQRKLLGKANFIVLFRTTDDPMLRKDAFSMAQKVKEAQAFINASSEPYPRKVIELQ